MKPSIILYKKLPDDLRSRLDEHFTVTEINNLNAETVAQHAEAFQQAEGILGSGGKVDGEFLQKAPKLRVASSVSVG